MNLLKLESLVGERKYSEKTVMSGVRLRLIG